MKNFVQGKIKLSVESTCISIFFCIALEREVTLITTCTYPTPNTPMPNINNDQKFHQKNLD